jgi:hypothetical protein
VGAETGAARQARNENFFRRINEGIEEVVEHSQVVHSAPVAFVCECSRDDCTTAIELTLDEYEEVRQDGRRFLVAPGHVNPSIERVVEENERFSVVEKRGTAGEIAENDA